ncbi:MAG: FeoB-associated Cys-rich membrane protein [Verrucomicrobiales bacterium]|nr:FeoB-associated Cys-rich membrane protein [Verrucomicrobiales bacterium]
MVHASAEWVEGRVQSWAWRIDMGWYGAWVDWQQWATLGIVGLALGLWIRSQWRAKKAGGCGGGCCGTTRLGLSPRVHEPRSAGESVSKGMTKP